MSYLVISKKLLTIKRYSYRTIKAYSNALKVFLLPLPDINLSMGYKGQVA